MANYTDTTALTNLIDTVYTKLVILKGQESSDLWDSQWLDKFSLAEYGAGSTIKVPVYSEMTAVSGALSETSNGDGVSLSASTADITLVEYGNYTTLTKKAVLTAVSQPVIQAVKLMGQNLGKSLDHVAFDAFDGCTNVLYGGDATSTATLAATDIFDVDLLIKAVAALRVKDAPTFDDGMYVCFIHPNQAKTLKQDSDFRASVSYAAYDKIQRGYVGTFQGCHVIESARVQGGTDAGSGSNLTYWNAIIFGQNAVGKGIGAEPSVIIKEPVDALNRFPTVGWSSLVGFSILVQDYIYRIESLES